MPTRISRQLLQCVFSVALVVVFVLAMIPVAVVPVVVSFQDKLHHSAAFAVLMLLGVAGWPGRHARLATGLLVYGVAIEVCQHTFTAHRVGEVQDVVADGLGIALGWLLARRTGGRHAPGQ